MYALTHLQSTETSSPKDHVVLHSANFNSFTW